MALAANRQIRMLEQDLDMAHRISTIFDLDQSHGFSDSYTSARSWSSMQELYIIGKRASGNKLKRLYFLTRGIQDG